LQCEKSKDITLRARNNGRGIIRRIYPRKARESLCCVAGLNRFVSVGGVQTTFRPLENATYNPRDRERQLSRVSEKGV
jgi:hypothetical protein